MRKIFKITALILTLILALSVPVGCSSLIGENYTLYQYIDTTYSLATNNELTDYSNVNEAQVPMQVASIIMPATYEINCTINYSYTAYTWGGFRPGSNYSQKVSSSESLSATAFMINMDGYLLTNAHVVTLSDNTYAYNDLVYDSWDIKLSLPDSDVTFKATVVAYDIELDLAILKMDTTSVNTDSLEYAVFYNLVDPSKDASAEAIKLYYGEMAVAVGNAYGYGISVTTGCVSAPIRYFTNGSTVTKAIQTDAAINEGNSGGPLCNAFGRVIGVNSFKIRSGTVDNLGFAIPSYVVLEYIDSINNGTSSGTVLLFDESIQYYYTNSREYSSASVLTNVTD